VAVEVGVVVNIVASVWVIAQAADEREDAEAEVEVDVVAMPMTMSAVFTVVHQHNIGIFGGSGIKLERLQAARSSRSRDRERGGAQRGNARHSQFLPIHHGTVPFLLPFSAD
jgi:hypothetical protein